MTAASTSASRHHDDPLGPRFAALYEAQFERVWTNLRRLGVQGPELDDAVQETFLVVFRRWDPHQPDHSQRAWLFGIARRIASRYRRGRSRRLRLLAAAAPTNSPVVELEGELTRRQATRLLQAFLDGLDARKRDAFVLADVEGFTGAEIAEILHISPNTVGSRVRAAREAFDRYVERLVARERGAGARVDRQRLVRRAREARPPQDARRRAHAALVAHLAAPVAAGPGWGLSLKPIALAAGLGIVGAGGVLAVTSSSGSSGARSHREAAAGIDAPARLGGAAVSADDADPVGTTTSGLGDAAPQTGERPGSGSTTGAVDPERASSPRVLPLRPRAGIGTGPGSPTRAQMADTFSAETRLVLLIRAAVTRGDFTHAQDLARLHARRFPGGVLAPERWVLEVAIWCGLGRTDEAAALVRAHPEHRAVAQAHARCRATDTSGPQAEE